MKRTTKHFLFSILTVFGAELVFSFLGFEPYSSGHLVTHTLLLYLILELAHLKEKL